MSADQQPLAGRVALVTGASRGIGRAVAVRLAEDGAVVAVHYARQADAAEAVAAGLVGSGHVIVQADIRNPDAVAALVGEVVSRAGRLDVLVNNAGIYVEHPIAETSYEDWRSAWDETLRTNLVGPANLCWCAARHMISRGGGGRIINISSRGAVRGEPDFPAYGASKAAINAMGQSLARALGPHGISVTTVAPGFVETDMARPFLEGAGGDDIRSQSPLGRVGRPEEVAAAVAYLARDDAEYATGAVLDLFGASYLR